MLCPNTQGQWTYPLAFTSDGLFPPRRNPIYPSIPSTIIANEVPLDDQPHRQWPWRLFPFASDLGTVGCLLNRPKLGILGWMIATPYYLYAFLKQPDARQRKDETLYQATANGIFPLIEAKIGVKLGEVLYHLASKSSMLSVETVKQSHCKLLGGLLALITLTPTLGDPVSHQICRKYQSHQLNVTV
jgi:hypothetical protein